MHVGYPRCWWTNTKCSEWHKPKHFFCLLRMRGKWFQINRDRRWNMDLLWQSRNQTTVTTMDTHKYPQTNPNSLITWLKWLWQQKITATVFWNHQNLLLVDFMIPRQQSYRCLLSDTAKTRRAIQNKRRGTLSSGVVLIYDAAWLHSGAATQQIFQN